jgi:hypothetical protein
MADYVMTALAPTAVATDSDRSLAMLRSQVRKNMQGDSVYFPDEDIDYWLNKALEECSEIVGEYKQSEDQTTVVGTYRYLLPDNCINITDMTYDNRPLIKVDLSWILEQYNTTNTPPTLTGTPSNWAEDTFGYIRLFPTPVEAKTLTIYFEGYHPALAADTDIIQFSRRADDVCVQFASMQLSARDGENGKYGMYKDMYKTAKGQFIIAQKKKPQFTKYIDNFEDGGPYNEI